jgi:DNA primase
MNFVFEQSVGIVPVTAIEFERKLRRRDLKITTVFKRLRLSVDLWKAFWDSVQTLDEAVEKATQGAT